MSAPVKPSHRPFMTSAELRLTRERLGLSQTNLGDLLEVTQKTVLNWESGRYRIPEGVAVDVEGLAEETEEFIEAIVAELSGDPDLDEHGEQWIITHRDEDAYRVEWPEAKWSAGWHRAAMGRVAEQVPGVRVRFLSEEGPSDG